MSAWWWLVGLAAFMSAALGATPSTAQDRRYDVVIRNGRVVDGSGAPWYLADIGVCSGRIVHIGRIESPATRVIDAAGLIVAPGFIDMMGQTATPLLEDSAAALNLLTQGITTINAGEGASAAPLGPDGERRYGWRTIAEYFQLLDLHGLPVNVTQTVGHTQIRELVLGEVDRRPTPAELETMQAHVREAMDAGAIGVSTALIYPPAVYAETEELIALAKTAGESGGRYFTHMRNEGDRLLEAIDEALQIGREAHVPVHIFHLKAAGQQNWGKMPQAIARIKAARAAGQPVTADIYPYINNGLGIAALIHPRYFAEGHDKLIRRLDDAALRAEIRRDMETTDGWENWYRHVGRDWSRIIIGQANDLRYAPHSGKSVAEIAQSTGEDPWETFFQLVRTGAFALPQSMSEANLLLALQQEFVSFCTDVGPAKGTSIASHPRAFGALPRVLSRYVRDLGASSLERAVSQASAVAANELLAYDRGRIAIGQAADLVLLDFEQLADTATFAQPHSLSRGVRFVLVNGVVVLDEGKYTGKRPGRVLRGPGYRSAQAPHRVATGPTHPAFARVDEAMAAFLAQHRLPGVALALTNQGRLVHARGYGYADVATREPVAPASKFRIASISKPITAVAVLKLVDQGRLTLDERVFDILPFEPHLEPQAHPDERQRAMTVRQLLEHRGGWDRDVSFDGMFRAVEFAKALGAPPPAGPAEVIRVMSGKPLDFAPGERYAYSNYGYCLLGRVIEIRSGQKYDDFVSTHVLKPLGISGMSLGRTRLEDRQPGEVRYYEPAPGESVFASDLGQRVPHPYGAWHLEAMDAHGAWLASATDLARFACAFDVPERCPILSAKLVSEMFVRPTGRAGYDQEGRPRNQYYGLGWSVEVGLDGKLTAGHSGSLPGTNTRLVRRPDGRHIVLLFNARGSALSPRIADAALQALQPALAAIAEWPNHDWFAADP